ncbi:hypothetical protein WG909_06390 [Peptostreptococcaceae bacterium AGR-M142]
MNFKTVISRNVKNEDHSLSLAFLIISFSVLILGFRGQKIVVVFTVTNMIRIIFKNQINKIKFLKIFDNKVIDNIIFYAFVVSGLIFIFGLYCGL